MTEKVTVLTREECKDKFEWYPEDMDEDEKVTVLTREECKDKFGWYPEDAMQPSGTCPYSRAVDVQLKLTLDEETGTIRMPPMPESTITPEKLEQFKKFQEIKKKLDAEGGGMIFF